MTIIETCPKCGHDLRNSVIAVIPPISRKECTHCGWSWEGKPEDVVRVPFGGGIQVDIETAILGDPFFGNSPCKHCGNNPANGGSGICHCILGQQPLQW